MELQWVTESAGHPEGSHIYNYVVASERTGEGGKLLACSLSRIVDVVVVVG